MKFIENLQQKPKKTRILIMWTATICVMMIILIIWLFSFSWKSKNKEIESGIESTNLPSLFQSISKDFSIIKEKLQASFKSIKDLTNEGEQGQQ